MAYKCTVIFCLALKIGPTLRRMPPVKIWKREGKGGLYTMYCEYNRYWSTMRIKKESIERPSC